MSPPPARTQLYQRGFALIAVMWVVIIAGVILLGVQKAARANLAMAYNELESVRARWLARAGVERAMSVLAEDSPAVDGAWDAWYSNPESFQQVELIGGAFSVVGPPPAGQDPRQHRYGLVDHCARLNVNVAEAKQLKAVCDLANWQVDPILDWRDADNDPRGGGAEAQYYDSLTYPYLIRNGAFKTAAELKLVRDVSPALFVGEDADLDGILDANENDRDASLPDDDGDGQLTPALGGLVSVCSYELNRTADGEKRINMNTAGKTQLTEELNFTDALADGVVSSGPGGGGRDLNRGGKGRPTSRFDSMMDLLKVKPKSSPKDKNAPPGSNDENKVKEITVKWLAEHWDELTLTDKDRLEGLINVNTAPPAVLLTLPKMTASVAQAIVRRQVSEAGPFSSVGELLTGSVVTEEQFKALAEKITVRSSVFEIRSLAVTKRGIRHKIVAVVDRGAEPMTIIYWYQSE